MKIKTLVIKKLNPKEINEIRKLITPVRLRLLSQIRKGGHKSFSRMAQAAKRQNSNMVSDIGLLKKAGLLTVGKKVPARKSGEGLKAYVTFDILRIEFHFMKDEYDTYLRASIRRGLQDVKHGRVLTQKQVEKRLRKLI